MRRVLPNVTTITGAYHKFIKLLSKKFGIGTSTIVGGKELNFLTVDSDGKISVLKITDPLPAGTNIIGQVKITDETTILPISTGVLKSINVMQGDGIRYQRMIPSTGDALTNAHVAAVTSPYNRAFNGTTWDRIRSDISDGGDINNSTIGCQMVINLNYVWDSANTKWVPMTQPT